MSYFTVYHGNNEATMFNAECATGALVSRMLELLLPNVNIYTRLELVPLTFVLEQFKPPAGSCVTSAANRSGQQPHDAAFETNTTSARTVPFTGNIPLLGLATRPVESYADTLLGGATTAAPSPSAASSSAATAAGGGVSNAAAGSAGGISGAPSVSLQNCYVLLGCRHHHHHQPQQIQDSTNTPATTAYTGGSRASPTAIRRLGGVDAIAMEHRTAVLRRAQIIAAVPIVAPIGRGAGASSTAGKASASQQQQQQQQQSALGAGGTHDAALLLAHNNGLTLSGPSSAPWRKAFGQFLTTLLLPPTNETTSSANATAELDRLQNLSTTSPPSQALYEKMGCPTLLPAVATGQFNKPTPPITGYDVLWRSPRGEHLRLQTALDERVVTDIDTKKKRPKKS
ncbi:hypothetical protein DQ04_14061000 [Trypanosoma grayi]|uniref:hypothetical protein n=1 Tax=Trypanosoma grayi TaxID=71804 RepID=UPI0004F44006|nr:hypothetical protein DQ04_14061000 [Trypanosoma grayi]KEG06410.1 hypothetical protein DQ04_14061000 [Trypanosoma grayi]